MARVKKARVVRLLFCDFCGASQETCGLLIQGRDEVHICASCVSRCAEMVVEDAKANELSVTNQAGAALELP